MGNRADQIWHFAIYMRLPDKALPLAGVDFQVPLGHIAFDP